ncbi:MAG TPA: aromatic hydrocarbon degradation protein [Flavisolibacter sp.]|nr:aromatic hydrocarbon degradation protein [Flavisolibacter sp.]
MKLFITLVFTLSLVQIYAQEPADALRYGWTVPGGTARVRAIGGAMGSLGGDITATFINPAGIAFYKTGDFVLSPSYTFGKNNSSYLGRKETDKWNGLNWGTTGFVIGSGSGRGKIKNSAFSLAYNRSADFNTNILYRGFNNQSSYSQKYLEEIQNNNIKDANQVAGNFPFGTSLAFNTFYIDTIAGGSSNNFQFQTRAPIATGLFQQNTIQAHGGIDEIALAYAVNSNDKLYIGGSLGVPILHFKRTSEFIEADTTSNQNNKFNFAQVTENLSTKGVGINLKIGLIYKIADMWRVGLAIHSPTLYQLTDNTDVTLTTDTEGYQGVQTQSSGDVTGANAAFKYMLVTPYKVLGSISYVLREVEDVTQQKGFITADVEYINYKSASFKVDQNNNNDQATVDYLNSLDNAIKNAYKGAFNFRVGGELKFTTIMARAGFSYYGNPYKNINGENGNRMNISGGLGYRNKGFFMDLTYVQQLNKDVNFAYRLQSAPYYGANIKTSAGSVYLTFGFKI